MTFPKFRFWIIEGLAYWLERERPDQGRWSRPLGLIALVLAVEIIAFLWITGAFRILG